MAKNEKKVLEKKNWKSQFLLTGEVKINDYTYKIEEKAEKSDWVYSLLNLGVNCGSICGTVYAEMMGGYGAERDNVLHVHGKKDGGQDDFDNRFTVDWDDRENETILETVGDSCFVTIGIEKDKNDKLFVKKFLSPYDAINYIKENLKNGTVVNVRGNIEYSVYQEKVQTRKRITSIFLAKTEDHSEFAARFSQTLLLRTDSLGKIDKNKGIIPVNATVLEYMRMWKDKEVKQIVPLNKTFEYKIDMENEVKTKKLVDKYLRVKRGITEITFDGLFIEGGSLVKMTVDDLPDDIKELIELEAYTEEEALAKCSENTGKEKRMVLLRPNIRFIGEGENRIPAATKIEQKYSEEDLLLDFMVEDSQEDAEELLLEAEELEDEIDINNSAWLDEL